MLDLHKLMEEAKSSGSTINYTQISITPPTASVDFVPNRDSWPRGGNSMKMLITVFPGEDGYFIAECPVIPGCVSQGSNQQEAIDNIKEAIQGCLEVASDLNLSLSKVVEIEVPV